MRRCFFADRMAIVHGGTLLTVTATCYEGHGRLTSQVNGKTVLDESVDVKTEEEFEDNAEHALERLHRASASPIFESTLERCEISGRIK